MQAINSIQNAMINANANIQGALVVDSANAHRAYPSLVPCVSVPVTKRPGKPTVTSTKQPTGSLRRPSLLVDRTGMFTNGPSGGMWRLDRIYDRMPTAGWSTRVLNPAMRD